MTTRECRVCGDEIGRGGMPRHSKMHRGQFRDQFGREPEDYDEVVAALGPDPDGVGTTLGDFSDDVDDRTVFLPPAGTGSWYESDPGRFHTTESCAERGTPWREGARTREWFLERAVKEGYRPCGICAAGLEHDFVPADYPPGTRADYPGFEPELIADGGREKDNAAIKRRRAIRSALAALLALPPLVMVVLDPIPFGTWRIDWPIEWQIIAAASIAMSLAVGWKPAYESWFGDQSIYVDEPEVDDDWEL